MGWLWVGNFKCTWFKMSNVECFQYNTRLNIYQTCCKVTNRYNHTNKLNGNDDRSIKSMRLLHCRGYVCPTRKHFDWKFSKTKLLLTTIPMINSPVVFWQIILSLTLGVLTLAAAENGSKFCSFKEPSSAEKTNTVPLLSTSTKSSGMCSCFTVEVGLVRAEGKVE